MKARILAIACGSGLVLLLATTALLAAGPSPAALLAVARGTAHGTTAPDRAITALATLGGWALVAWLSLGATLTALGRLPGAVGRLTDAVAARCLPTVVRRLVEVALGVTVATGTLGGIVAMPAGATPPAPRPALASTLPDLDWPDRHPAGAATAASLAGTVVVRPGDSLWRVAARALGPHASDAQIAASWPRWYAANRAVIGPDPGLLLPGQRLVPPA